MLKTITGNQVFIIAEAGVNHNGDIELAKKLIDAAKQAGADCVKFQTWVTDELVDISAPKAEYQKINEPSSASQYEMLKKLELSFEQFRELNKYAKDAGILFLSTPDEYKSLCFLADDLNLPLIKVGSGEINNSIFLKQIGEKKLPVLLSTGMSYIGDIEKAYYTLIENGAAEVAILHCTSEYPAPYGSVNLNAINTLKKVFGAMIGYSDHTEGIVVSVAAVAVGARIIEKHFTIDKSLPGPDHKASIDPKELAEMVRAIRIVEQAMGNGVKAPQKGELQTKKVVQKGVYASRNIKSGEILRIEDVVAKRPTTSIKIEHLSLLLGRPLKMDVSKGMPLSLNNFDFG